MNEMTLDQNDQEFFTYEVSDEALEVAASSGKANTFTQWMCTAVFFALVLKPAVSKRPLIFGP
jgi:hypothetical protein